MDEPMVWYEGATVSSATRRYLHADHQGSIVATANAAGTKLDIGTYDAYGVTTAPSSWRFQYTGQTAIPQVGLYYYKARFYNPSLGRFMQTDPIGYDDDANLYAYVGNDPLNKSDPTGEWAHIVYGAIAGAVGGYVGSSSGWQNKLAGTVAGAAAGAAVAAMGGPSASNAAGMAVAGAAGSAGAQVLEGAGKAAMEGRMPSISDIEVSGTKVVVGAAAAVPAGKVAQGVSALTRQPIVGSLVSEAGTPTIAGHTAGAVAEGGIAGFADRVVAPAVEKAVTNAKQVVERLLEDKKR